MAPAADCKYAILIVEVRNDIVEVRYDIVEVRNDIVEVRYFDCGSLEVV